MILCKCRKPGNLPSFVFNLCAKCVQNSRLDIKITPFEEKSSNFIHLTRYNCSTRNISQYIKRYSMQGNATTVPPAFNHIFLCMTSWHTTLPSTRRASFNTFFSILILTSMSLLELQKQFSPTDPERPAGLIITGVIYK